MLPAQQTPLLGWGAEGGGQALGGQRELARELVRRARRKERLCALLAELPAAGDALAEGGGDEGWRSVAAKVRKALKWQ